VEKRASWDRGHHAQLEESECTFILFCNEWRIVPLSLIIRLLEGYYFILLGRPFTLYYY